MYDKEIHGYKQKKNPHQIVRVQRNVERIQSQTR